MKVARNSEGFLVDAHDLGPLLGVDPAAVPDLMRAGKITSQSEDGADEDAGKTRLTFWYADLRVRLVCDADGNVLTTTRTPTGRAKAAQ